jgi:hypothetical protein
VLDDFVIRVVSRTAPGLVPAGALHRGALAAATAGRHGEADRLFESAARSYRRSLDVEGLARLRVHQRMARARALRDPVLEAEAMIEIIRGLNRLDQLESFRPPHRMENARTVLSQWLSESGSGFDADAECARLTA